MKILLNGSTLVKGGALQVAASLAREIVVDPMGCDWYFLLSPPLERELETVISTISDRQKRVVWASPAHSASVRREVKNWVNGLELDTVFTIFGPAYITFNVPHVMGVANAWVTHSDALAFSHLDGVLARLRTLLGVIYRGFWYRKADGWIVEADNAKRGLWRRLRCPPNRVHVVPNTCGSHYLANAERVRRPPLDGKLRLLCLSAYYRHKNLEIIPFVAKSLLESRPKLDFEFVVTLPAQEPGLERLLHVAGELGVERYLVNIGPVLTENGPSVYESCHISFLPSVLETFSANYPEAMAMGLPIVTSNLDFARAVCGESAIYFSPENPEAAAASILKLIDNEALWLRLVEEGKSVLERLPTSKSRYASYLNVIRSVASP